MTNPTPDAAETVRPRPPARAVTSAEAVTVWSRSDKPRECVCCPGEPGHIYGYNARLTDPDAAPRRHRGRRLDSDNPTDQLDYQMFVYDAIRAMPEGTRFTITVTPRLDITP